MSTPNSERRCPYCGEEITMTSILCPRCGRSVAASTWPPQPMTPYLGVTSASRPILGGILASNAAAAVLITLNDWLVRRGGGENTTLVASDFLLVPFVMGIICAFFWRRLGMKTLQYFLFSLLNSGIAILVSAFFMGEGVICLLIVSPLILLLVFAGSLLGRAIFRKNSSTLNFSLIPLVLLVMVSDSLSKHEYHASVSDRVVIHARPSQVWQQIAAFPTISDPPRFWLFRMGLPYPIAAAVSRRGVGADRRCIFSGGLVFDERISEWVPNKRLTFDVVRQPDNPEIFGHAAVKRGQFRLLDNRDGTTTLIGTSWYDLYVYPSWYYDLWARSIARGVHLRVMDHVKEVCEASHHV